MLLVYQVAEFLNQLLMNECDFKHADIDSRNIKVSLQTFSWVWSEVLIVSQIVTLLNQLFLKSTKFNLLGFLLARIERRTTKIDLKIFNLVRSERLLANQISGFLNQLYC